MTIPAICVVPEEYKKDKWPRSFAAIPNLGDLVKSRTGKVLQVHSVTHVEDNTNSPNISVELASPAWGTDE